MIAQNNGITLQLTESSESRKYNFFRNSSPVSYDVRLTSISDTQIDFTIDTAGLTDKRLTVTGTELSAVKLNNALSNDWSFSGGINTIDVNSASTVSLFFNPLPTSPSSGGGSGGDKSKPSISNISNSLEGVEDLLDSKIILEVGQPTTISMMVRENQGINNLEHVSLYLDTRQPDLSRDFKTTHIRWEKNNPLSINNPSNMLDSANIVATPIDAVNTKIEIEFSFAVPLDSVYLHLVIWDLSRNQIQQDYPDAIQVVPSKILQTKSETDSENVEPKMDPEPIFSWQVFNRWAGYSSEVTSDKEFLSHLGIEGNKIPIWMKNQNAKWVKEGLITQQNFLDAINNLYERKIIQ
ncbi:hypothetical protein NSED_01790 [Candidatus Nitrosopumilus sediminis]|uniref:Uncharacterized protein n=2 Tax=Candidatus Nitrosopumilus sediminis TaxID=1229909 RepID=K0BB00_9ARCH|nr:hypothetical protein NSED_01790 [Candidatus Nitrosopumilus sediminis]